MENCCRGKNNSFTFVNLTFCMTGSFQCFSKDPLCLKMVCQRKSCCELFSFSSMVLKKKELISDNVL